MTRGGGACFRDSHDPRDAPLRARHLETWVAGKNVREEGIMLMSPLHTRLVNPIPMVASHS